MLIHIYILQELDGIEEVIMFNITKINTKGKQTIIIHYHLVIFSKKMKQYTLHLSHHMELRLFNHF